MEEAEIETVGGGVPDAPYGREKSYVSIHRQ